jgi:hypothetical protein
MSDEQHKLGIERIADLKDTLKLYQGASRNPDDVKRIVELEAREKELVAVYAGAKFSLNAAHNKHDFYKKAVQDVMGSKFYQVQNRLNQLAQQSDGDSNDL